MKRATIFLLLMAGTGCKPPATPRISVHAEVRHDVSLPLHQLPPAPPLAGDQDDERDEIRTPLVFGRAATVDPLRQRLQFAGAALQLATTFEGVGWNFPMPSGGRWLATFHPADSNGDVGPSHYVQVTNSGF